jgi:salicylate hydroxylase
VHAILIGAGIGGLTAALALGRLGVSVTVLERSPVLGEVGAGVQLGPNATRILFDLGLEAALRDAAFAPEAAEIRSGRTGALRLRNPLGAKALDRWGAPYLQIHRADLQKALVAAVQAAPAVGLRLGADVLDHRQDDTGVDIILKTGETIRGDVAIGCDGLRSCVREQLFGQDAATFTGQVAWRAVVPTERLPTGLIPPIAAVWTGAGKHCVHYFVTSGRAVNFVGVVARDWRIESWSEIGARAELIADFAGWPEPVEAICRAAESPFRWALYDRPPLARWSVGRVGLLGDACHPMLPFLAQGAAMAIEDAAVLARQVASTPDVSAALSAYEALRKPRTSRVQAASRFNARLFHLPDPVGGVAFAAAGAVDRITPGGAAARFDWLYGYMAP